MDEKQNQCFQLSFNSRTGGMGVQSAPCLKSKRRFRVMCIDLVSPPLSQWRVAASSSFTGAPRGQR